MLEAEVARLRRGMRDLAAVTLLHGLWDGRSVADIADGLCGTVYQLLDLDASVVQVGGPDGVPIVVSYPPARVDAAAVLARGERALAAGDALVGGSGIAVHRVDLGGIHAVAVGLASRAGFPSDVEAMIFRAVANEASIAARASGRLNATRAANQTLASVVEQLPIGVAVAAAPSGRLVLRNAALDALLRACADGVDEPTFHDLDALRHDGARYAPGGWPLDRSLATGEVVRDEEVVVRAMGRQRVLSISSVPVHDPSGVVVAAVATVDDISGRKDTEALRDAFISMLSHELRTPVTTIYAGSQLLRRRGVMGAPDGGSDSSRELLDDIALEAERLDRIVQNFLVLARVERGAQVHGHEPVLIQRLVPRVVEREQSRWADRSIVAELPPGLPPVGADEASVELVVRNLVNNAAKYGGPRVHVAVVAEQRQAEVVVRVLDDGPGLTPEEAGRVFDLFYRSSRVSGTAEGAGVGLYAVSAAIAAMGGSTWARGRPEGGAEFGFTLPVWDEDAGESPG